jgi:hypothetical protein
MLVALGEDGIKTIEDFAGCAADDLVGWTERKDGETKRFDGRAVPGLRRSRAPRPRQMILQARLKAGWITDDLKRNLARRGCWVTADRIHVDRGGRQEAIRTGAQGRHQGPARSWRACSMGC